jgi:hypothetical protein
MEHKHRHFGTTWQKSHVFMNPGRIEGRLLLRCTTHSMPTIVHQTKSGKKQPCSSRSLIAWYKEVTPTCKLRKANFGAMNGVWCTSCRKRKYDDQKIEACSIGNCFTNRRLRCSPCHVVWSNITGKGNDIVKDQIGQIVSLTIMHSTHHTRMIKFKDIRIIASQLRSDNNSNACCFMCSK